MFLKTLSDYYTSQLVSLSKTSNSTRLSDSCYFDSYFEKLTRARSSQIALEIMLLSIQNS